MGGVSEHHVRYEIVVKGRLDERWERRFEGMAITPLPDGQTLLAGRVLDQPALHGILSRVRDLGLVLVSVTRREDQGGEPVG